MTRTLKNIASITGFVFAGFLGLFALDTPFGLGFFIHLIPSLLIVIACAAGLKNALAGGISTAVLFVVFTFFFHTWRAPAPFLIVSLPLFIISALFLFSAKPGKKDNAKE
ncbi:MAG: hypothetical protein JW803_02585 [Endomicrobiales bacterium]|nr:hypothetical protein [Endomicrobiales bacterium]